MTTATKQDLIQVDGKWRPTTNSKGKLIHPTLEGIVNFWKWFGESKVVDGQGRPLVVYHGTSQPFKAFAAKRLGQSTKSKTSLAFFFTDDPREAEEYADLSAGHQFTNAVEMEKKQAQLQVKIAAAERRNDWNTAERLMEELENLVYGDLQGEPSDQQILPVYLRIFTPAYIDMRHSIDLRLREALMEAKKSKIDGVILKNVYDPVAERRGRFSTNQWAVFKSTQIKSATGNRGSFSPSDPVMTNPRRCRK